MISINNVNDRYISIHAPHEGERPLRQTAFFLLCFISIHAPHEGERHSKIKDGKSSKIFQSTLPTRGSDHRGHEMG